MQKAPKGKGAGPSHKFSSPGVSSPRGVPTVNWSGAGVSAKTTGIDKADKSRRKKR